MKSIKLIILASVAILTGCSSDQPDSFETPISGYYKIVSFESTTAVDMNNDGIKTKNLYNEISMHKMDNEMVHYYDFDFIGNYMEVRPLHQTNSAKLIDFNIPDQRIDYLRSGSFFLEYYIPSFIHYSYKLKERSRKIELINGSPDFIENGTLNDLEHQKDGSLKLEMTKELFDFVDSKWIETDVTIIYQKVDLD